MPQSLRPCYLLIRHLNVDYLPSACTLTLFQCLSLPATHYVFLNPSNATYLYIMSFFLTKYFLDTLSPAFLDYHIAYRPKYFSQQDQVCLFPALPPFTVLHSSTFSLQCLYHILRHHRMCYPSDYKTSCNYHNQQNKAQFQIQLSLLLVLPPSFPLLFLPSFISSFPPFITLHKVHSTFLSLARYHYVKMDDKWSSSWSSRNTLFYYVAETHIINKQCLFNYLGALIDVFRAINQIGESILKETGILDWSWVAKNNWSDKQSLWGKENFREQRYI